MNSSEPTPRLFYSAPGTEVLDLAPERMICTSNLRNMREENLFEEDFR